MMVWEGALFVLVKVKDCIIKEKHLILSSAPKDKWTIFFPPEQRCRAAWAYDTRGRRRGRASATVWPRASAKEPIDFTGLISAISVNYSCVLIVWLEETKTTSLTEQTCMLRQHVYSFACARLIRL